MINSNLISKLKKIHDPKLNSIINVFENDNNEELLSDNLSEYLSSDLLVHVNQSSGGIINIIRMIIFGTQLISNVDSKLLDKLNIEKDFLPGYKEPNLNETTLALVDDLKELCIKQDRLLSEDDPKYNTVLAKAFMKLTLGIPLTPLTGADDEWQLAGIDVEINKRYPDVVRYNNDNNQAYNVKAKLFTLDGVETFTNSNSKELITFPYTVPINTPIIWI